MSAQVQRTWAVYTRHDREHHVNVSLPVQNPRTGENVIAYFPARFARPARVQPVPPDMKVVRG